MARKDDVWTKWRIDGWMDGQVDVLTGGVTDRKNGHVCAQAEHKMMDRLDGLKVDKWTCGRAGFSRDKILFDLR